MIVKDENVCDKNKTKYIIEKLELLLSHLRRIYSNILSDARNDDLSIQLSRLIAIISNVLLPKWRSKCHEALWHYETLQSNSFVRRVCTGAYGHPKLEVNVQQINFLREIGFTWSNIASILGISTKSLYNKRVKLGIVDVNDYTSLSDSELLDVVCTVKEKLPDVGEKMLLGILNSRGIKVRRKHLRQAIHIVDPINTTLRWSSKLHRRIYSVPGPNSLWHGNH